MVLWSRSILGRQRVPWKVPARFRQQARFHQGSSSVSASPAQIRLGLPTASVLKGSMEFAKIVGQILFGVPKGSVEGSPITSLNVSPGSTTLFLHFSQQLSLWSSVIKVLGQNDMFVFLRSWQHMAFASQKVFWSVPQTVISIGLTVSCGFFGQTSEKVLCKVPPTILHICLPQGCCFIQILWKVPPTLHLSQSRVNC